MNTKMLFAALMLSLTLAACAKKDEAPADMTSEPAPAAEPAPADTMPMEEGMPTDGTAPTDETAPPADAAETPPAQ
jgi:hypothetical protein